MIDVLKPYAQRNVPIVGLEPSCLFTLRDALPGAAALSEKWLGLSARRSLPKWRADTFLRGTVRPARKNAADEVVLLADTFNNYFEPENLRAALRVLEAAHYTVHIAYPRDGGRPLQA